MIGLPHWFCDRIVLFHPINFHYDIFEFYAGTKLQTQFIQTTRTIYRRSLTVGMTKNHKEGSKNPPHRKKCCFADVKDQKEQKWRVE